METFDTPWDRFQTVTLGMLAHRSGPNVLLGLFVGAALQSFTPDDVAWVVGAGAAWFASVIAYSVADERVQALAEDRKRLLEPIGDTPPKGIE